MSIGFVTMATEVGFYALTRSFPLFLISVMTFTWVVMSKLVFSVSLDKAAWPAMVHPFTIRQLRGRKYLHELPD